MTRSGFCYGVGQRAGIGRHRSAPLLPKGYIAANRHRLSITLTPLRDGRSR